MKTIFSRLCSLLVMALLLLSCTKDHSGIVPDDTGDLNVVLSLDLPGGFLSAGTRGLTIAQENSVENLTVLVFDRDNLISDIKQARLISGNTWGVTVAQSEGDDAIGPFTFNLMLVANAQELITDGRLGFTDFRNISGAIGKSEADVCSALTRYVEQAMYMGSETKAIPMWGQTGHGVIDRRNPTRSVSLIRSLSRVDVGVGTPSGSAAAGFSWDGVLSDMTKFDLQKVYIMRPNQYLSILPKGANINEANMATAPSLPIQTAQQGQWNVTTSITKFGYNVTDGNYITQEIYVPESDIRKGSTALGGANHGERMAVVVGGSYMDGPTTWYRLDFAKNNALMDVLRNHVYQFNITNVAGPGYGTPEEAYRSLSMNMTADVVEWNVPTIGDITFDGQYHFGIESRTVAFPASGGVKNLAVTSNQNWTLTGGSMFTYSPINGTPSTTSLSVTAGANSGGTRSETVTITAGRNKIQLTVTQMGQRTLNFDTQGGSAVGSITVGGGTPGNAIAWPTAPTLTGKKFGGWYTAPADPSTRVDGNPQWTMPDANTTLYARWVDGTERLVVFNSNGGKTPLITTMKVSELRDLNINGLPTRSGWRFTGYVSSSDILYFNYQGIFMSPAIPDDEIINLFATWDRLDMTINDSGYSKDILVSEKAVGKMNWTDAMGLSSSFLTTTWTNGVRGPANTGCNSYSENGYTVGHRWRLPSRTEILQIMRGEADLKAKATRYGWRYDSMKPPMVAMNARYYWTYEQDIIEAETKVFTGEWSVNRFLEEKIGLFTQKKGLSFVYTRCVLDL